MKFGYLCHYQAMAIQAQASSKRRKARSGVEECVLYESIVYVNLYTVALVAKHCIRRSKINSLMVLMWLGLL